MSVESDRGNLVGEGDRPMAKRGKRCGRNGVRSAEARYHEAKRCAVNGRYARSKQLYERLLESVSDGRLMGLIRNDLAALAAVAGDTQAAIRGFQAALALDRNCEPARLNLALVEADEFVEGRALRGERQRKEETGDERRETEEAGERGSAGEGESGRGGEAVTERPRHDETGTHGPNFPTFNPQRSTRYSQRFPKCLLLLITYNRLEYTRLALDAVLKLDYPALEIVVWDNASTDGSVEYLKSRLDGVPRTRLILSPTNMGVVYPMNAVWFSDHDAGVLAKVDNDTLVPPELIRRLAECHVGAEQFGVLSGFHFRREGQAIADERNLVTVNGVRVFRQKYVGGCAVMVRRQVVERIGAIPCRSPTPSPPAFSPGAPGLRENRPFLESGWTQYQQWLNDAGLINGYPWPPVHVDHMEDTRSDRCIKTEEHQQYKQAMRGMTLEEFTQELCVWRPH